jgi:hypothetical protein
MKEKKKKFGWPNNKGQMKIQQMDCSTFQKGWPNNKGQMKIQQMAFMIIAVFLFFVLVGLFLLKFQLKDIKNDASSLNRDQAISSLEVIASSPELNCGSSRTLCLDEDKLKVMSGSFGEVYSKFWPISAIKVYKVYPRMVSEVKCPALDCNYFLIYDKTGENKQEYSTYVNICKKIRLNGYVTEKCEIGKLVVAMRALNEK